MKVKITKLNKIKHIKIKRGFVVCGDVHLYNNYPYNNYTNVISDRLLDITRAVKKAGKAARLYKLPLILNGDIITSGIFDYPVEHVLTDFLLEFKDIEIFINLGNHDLDGDVSVLEPLIEISEKKHHHVITKAKMFKHKGMSFFIAPFEKEKNAIKTINTLLKTTRMNNYSVLFIHNSFKGSVFANKVKSKSGIEQNNFTDKFDLIVASHIHKYQKICNGKGFYTSSIIPLNFGEKSKEHGYHIVDVDNDIRYFVIPKSPKFVLIKRSNIKTTNDSKINNNIIKVINDLNKPIDKMKIRNELMSRGARFVTFKNKKIESTSKLPQIKNKTPEQIVVNYSKVLSEEFDYDQDILEKEGLNILNETKKEVARKTQSR